MDEEIKKEILMWLSHKEPIPISTLVEYVQYGAPIPDPKYPEMKTKECVWYMILSGELRLNSKLELEIPQ